MSDPRKPDDPRDPERGALEEVREEIEQVVEGAQEEVQEIHDRIEKAVEPHLPPRARRRAGQIAWMIVGGLFALIVLLLGAAVLYVWRNSEWAAGRLTDIVNQQLRSHTDLVLEVRDLQGNPFRGVVLVEPRLRWRGQGGDPLLAARTMTLGYAPWNLAVGNRRSLQITLDHPVVLLSRDAEGRIRIPRWEPGPRAQRAGPAREVEVLIRLEDALVRDPEGAVALEGWDLEAMAVTGAASRVDVRSMRWARGPYDSRLEAFAGEMAGGDSVRFRIHRLQTADLALAAHGGWKRGESEKRVHLDLERVRWRWLATVFKNDVFDVDGEGRGSADAIGDRDWTGRANVHADWDGLVLDGQGALAWRDGVLDVAPLAATSPAGDLEGRVRFEPGRLTLEADVVDGDPAQWGALGLDGWPKGDLAGRVRYRSIKGGGATASHVEAELGSSEIAGWRADSAYVRVDFPASNRDSFGVDFRRQGGRARIAGRIEPGRWEGDWVATNFPLEEWPDGRASGLTGRVGSGAGTVEGRDGGLFVTGRLDGRDTRWFGAEIDAWRLERLDGRLLPTPDLAIDARLDATRFLGIAFDSAAASLDLGDQRMRLDSVRAHASDTLLTMAGEASWNAGRGAWRLDLDRARATRAQFDWTGAPPVRIAGDADGVVFDGVRLADGDARLAFDGRWAVPGGFYDFRAQGERLELARLGLPLDWKLAGLGDATLTVRGPAADPQWVFDGRASAPGSGGRSVDSLTIGLHGRPHQLEVRELTANLGDGFARAQVRFDRLARDWPERLEGDAVMRWLEGASSWSGELTATRLPLERLEAIVPASAGLSGPVTARATLAGSPSDPRIELDAEAAPFAWNTVAVDAVKLRARYADERLEVPELRATSQQLVSTVEGSMPLRLAVGRKVEVPDAPMRWDAKIPNGDLGLIVRFVPQLAEASGRFALDARLDGTPRDYRLDGRFEIQGGSWRPAGRSEVLHDVRLVARLGDEVITVDTLTARQGREGRLSGHGRIELDRMRMSSYLFDVSLRQFTSFEPGVYAAEFDADLRITPSPHLADRTLPYVTHPRPDDAVQIRNAIILYNFADQSVDQQVAATAQPLLWTFDLRVVARNRLHWRPPEGDIEFDADLSVQQTADSLQIFGEMRALRGHYYFLSNRFNLVRADLTFDNVGGVNPFVDAEATTRLVPVNTDEATTITVFITGRANEPTIDFDSSPLAMTESEILSELTIGRFTGDNAEAVARSQADSYLTRALNRQLSGELSQLFRGWIDEWELSSDRGGILGGGELYAGVGTQVTPNLRVRYTQQVPGFSRQTGSASLGSDPFFRDVEAEYRLSRFLYFTTEVVERTPSQLATSSTKRQSREYNVSLKARWEY